VGWLAGKVLAPENIYVRAAALAMILGITVALALSVVDGLWNLSGKVTKELFIRVLVAVAIGCIGGLFGGIIGQALDSITGVSVFRVIGWTLTGLLIGAAPGAYDVAMRLLRGEDWSGARKKLLNGTIGGAVGGFLGSIIYLIVRSALGGVFSKPPDELLSSSAVGFVALGACIGLLIGLAQVILKEAWIRVESGFRPGRELILSKPVTIIGRAEGSDIGLFGGKGVEKTHARIVKNGAEYLLADAQTPGGTFLNDQRIDSPTPLHAGDRIRVGNCVLLFQERKKSAVGNRPSAIGNRQ
jgi:hypothetical protein